MEARQQHAMEKGRPGKAENVHGIRALGDHGRPGQGEPEASGRGVILRSVHPGHEDFCPAVIAAGFLQDGYRGGSHGKARWLPRQGERSAAGA